MLRDSRTMCFEAPWYHTEKKTKRYTEQEQAKVEKYLSEIATIPISQIAYVDETGVDTYLYREYAYCPKGTKVYGKVSGRKYKRLGIVAAQVGDRIVAPLQYEGTMDSILFETWFENCLLPALPSNTVIVMDNAAFHRKSRLICLTKEYGMLLIFLPPYSPEHNPIEKFWSWLKRHLKKILPCHKSFDEALCSAFNVR